MTTVTSAPISPHWWSSLAVTATLFDASDVQQSTQSVTPSNGAWSASLAANSAGSYWIITESDGNDSRRWRISVPSTGGPYAVDSLHYTPPTSAGSGISQGDADARYNLKGVAVANVLDYGASTGATGAANLTAFQAAVNDANTKGLKVYVPGGTWNVNTGLLVGQRLTVEGAGRGRTVLNVQSTGTFVASASAGTRLFDWNWAGMTISTTTAATAFDMDSVSTAHFRDLVISGFLTVGIYIHSATSGGAVYNRFYDVTVQTSPTGWIIAADGSNAGQFMNCRANNCSVRGWDIQNSNDNLLDGCQFEASGVGVYLSGTVAGANAFNRIVNCRSEHNTTGIQIASANVSDTQIANLWVDSSTTTVLVDSGTRTRYLDKAFEKRVWLADDYGVLGDNSTDNTAALNTLITSVNTAGGGTIQFQDGKTYLYGRSPALGGSAASIVMKSNVTLRGNATLKLRNGICTDVTGSYFPVYCSAISNFKIRDLTFEGNSANNTTALVADIITMSGCENGQVLNVTINDCVDSGIMYSDNTNCLIDGVRLNGARDLGFYLNDTSNGTIATENTVTNCHINGAPNGGIALKRGAQKFIVTNNTIYNCGNGITMEQGAAAFFGHDSIIANNRIRHIGYIGTTNFYGIDLRGCDYVQCANNRIEDVVNYGINLAAARWTTVIGNVISHTTGTLADGIRVQDYPSLITTYGTSQTIISNNIVTDVTGDGINFVASASGTKNQYLTVTGNQFLGCARDGIETNANLDSVTISGNLFQGTITDSSVNASATLISWWGNRRLNGTGTVPTTSGANMQNGDNFLSGGSVTLGTSTSVVSAASTIPMYLRGAVSNNSSAVGVWLGNSTTLSTAGGRIAGFTTDTPQTHASPQAYIDIDGSYEFAAAGNKLMSGTGAPEGVVTAPVGSIWLRTDGSTSTTHYRKETGAGNTGWVASGASSGTGQMDATVAAMKPTAAHFETFARAFAPTLPTAGFALTSGTLYMTAIYLPAGEVVSSFSYKSGTVGFTTPTNWWFGLYSSARVQLATTADQLTAAWAGSTLQTLNIATVAGGAGSTYTVPSSGLYYVGICVASANNLGTIVGVTETGLITGLAPVVAGSSSTAQTAPQAFPFTAAAITAGSVHYAYTS